MATATNDFGDLNLNADVISLGTDAAMTDGASGIQAVHLLQSIVPRM